MKKIYFLITCIMCTSLCAMQKQKSKEEKSVDLANLPTNIINNQKVTPNNLDKFIAFMPQKLKKKIDAFIQRYPDFKRYIIEQKITSKDRADLLKDENFLNRTAAKYTNGDVQAIKNAISSQNNLGVFVVQRENADNFLKNSAINDLSNGSSYVFSLGEEYIWRISRPSTRAVLRREALKLQLKKLKEKYEQDIENIQKLDKAKQTKSLKNLEDVYNKNKKEAEKSVASISTYQTASNIFHLLRMQEFLKKNPETPVIISPEVYAYYVDGKAKNKVADSNIAAILTKLSGFQSVQKRIDSGQWKIDLDKLFPKNKPQRLYDTIRLFCYAGMFEGNEKNILYNPKENKLVYTDYEQPNTTLPGQEFNQKMINRPLHNIMAFLVGHQQWDIRGLLHTLQANKRVHDQALEYIAKDSQVKDYYLYNQYLLPHAYKVFGIKDTKDKKIINYRVGDRHVPASMVLGVSEKDIVAKKITKEILNKQKELLGKNVQKDKALNHIVAEKAQQILKNAYDDILKSLSTKK